MQLLQGGSGAVRSYYKIFSDWLKKKNNRTNNKTMDLMSNEIRGSEELRGTEAC